MIQAKIQQRMPVLVQQLRSILTDNGSANDALTGNTFVLEGLSSTQSINVRFL